MLHGAKRVIYPCLKFMFSVGECMFRDGERMFRIGERMFTNAKHKISREVISFLTAMTVFLIGISLQQHPDLGLHKKNTTKRWNSFSNSSYLWTNNPFPMNNSSSNCFANRLASLDVLRGLDLFLLVFFQPVFMKLARALDWPLLEPFVYQLRHEPWEGFRCWDMIMPLFMFMAGAAMPFSLSKYKNNTPALWKKVMRRFAILFILGMIGQGNLLGLDPKDIHLYVNTLQAIGVGYVITAFFLTYFNRKGQILATALLLIIYWVPMTFCGDWTPEGNFAYKVDQLIMGRFCGNPHYTWIWSSLTFGVTVMLGAFAGQIMKEGQANRMKACITLLVAGIALTIAGLTWSLQMPIIKHIWTCSMTLFAGGISFMLMALAYYIVDCRRWQKGLNWLKIYGMNSIVAYMIGEYISFKSIVDSVCYGLRQYLGDAGYNAWITFGNCLIVFLILRWMYNQRIFIKI